MVTTAGVCVAFVAVNPPAGTRPDAPTPLKVALGVVALEAVAFVVYGVLELLSLDSKRPEVSLTAGLFFLAYAAFLTFFAWRLARLESWARAPIVMGQLIHIPVALSFWGGDTKAVTVVLLTSSLVTLGGIFHPASIEAIEAAED